MCNEASKRFVRPPSDQVLATDLDGTLIPLPRSKQNLRDLQTLRSLHEMGKFTLIFNTGRHFDSVVEAIDQYELPVPDWIVCDVGTSIYQRYSEQEFRLVEAYQEHLDTIIASYPLASLRSRLTDVGDLRLQESEKQGRFKLSYYTLASSIEVAAGEVRKVLQQTQAPYSLIHSVDPFNGDGLIDLLPYAVNKSSALAWWVSHTGASRDHIVYAGDSGNDLAALTGGYRAIVVGNADRDLAERVREAHAKQGLPDRTFLAEGEATTGVLQGCRSFGLVESR